MTWYAVLEFLLWGLVCLATFYLITGTSLAILYFIRLVNRPHGDVLPVDCDDDDGFLVFDFSTNDPWRCGSCGREFPDRIGYAKPAKHYQYHHRRLERDT